MVRKITSIVNRHDNFSSNRKYCQLLFFSFSLSFFIWKDSPFCEHVHVSFSFSSGHAITQRQSWLTHGVPLCSKSRNPMILKNLSIESYVSTWIIMATYLDYLNFPFANHILAYQHLYTRDGYASKLRTVLFTTLEREGEKITF